MTSHYYSENQDSPLRPKTIKSILRNLPFEFTTGSGVFSKDHVDSGSKLLINEVVIKQGDRILDLGCGYGSVGIAIAKSFPDTKVVMTDINKRAVSLAIENCKQNSVGNVEVLQGNMYEKCTGKFNLILLNPPQSAGKKLCLEMMEKSKEHLETNGRFVFVARHRKGGKSMSEFLETIFGNLEVIARGSGFRVYEAKQISKINN